METLRPLVLFFDYVDPASRLLERRLHRLEPSGAFSLHHEPLELFPPPAPLLDPEDPEWLARWEAMEGEARALDVALASPPPWIVPWSRKAHELAFHARERGCFPALHDALFRAYLEEGTDIGRVDLLVEIGARHGLDRMETKAVLGVDRHLEALEEARLRALTRGIRRPPALLMDDRILAGYPEEGTLLAFLGLSSGAEQP